MARFLLFEEFTSPVVLDWDAANLLIKRYASYRVTDLGSGVSWDMVRCWGEDHADMEPATPEDTERMLGLFPLGLKFEEAVYRPVTVSVGGRELGAALMGVANGGDERSEFGGSTVDRTRRKPTRVVNRDYVRGNGVDGHFCLHFRGSVRHSDGKPDPSAVDAINSINSVNEAVDSKGREVFGDTDRKGQTVFYHGTASSNLPEILRKGLLVNTSLQRTHGYDTRGQVSLTTDYSTAFYYGNLFANNGPVTVLKVVVPTGFPLDKGMAFTEWVSYSTIPPGMIQGAYSGATMTPLSGLSTGKSYVNAAMLDPRDRDLARRKLGV